MKHLKRLLFAYIFLSGLVVITPTYLNAEPNKIEKINSIFGLESRLPTTIGGERVQCRTEGVRTDGNTKIKRCPKIAWHAETDNYPNGVVIFYWQSILLTAYDDNKKVRISFEHKRAGWQSNTKYSIYVHLIDKHSALLKTLQMTDSHESIGCDDPRRNDWHHFAYERALSGKDEFKYEDVAHVVYTLKVRSHSEWEQC